MSSFWGNSTGEKAELQTKIPPIPDRTIVPVILEEAKNDVYNGESFIKLTVVVIDGEYRNRKLFPKLKIYDDNSEKAETHRNALMWLLKATDTPVPEGAPEDKDLMQMCMKNKPFKCRVKVWDMDGKTGNWVSSYYPISYEEPVSAPDVNLDDEIPF